MSNSLTQYFKIAIQAALQDPGAVPATIKRFRRVTQVIKQGEARLSASKQEHQTAIPRFCIFSVTWRCNLDCVGCYASNYKNKKELTLAEIAATIRQACDLGTYLYVIAGGEPLLVKDLIPTLAGIEDAFFFLFTNGTVTDDRHIRSLQRTPNILPIVSIEGDADCTDRRRGVDVAANVAGSMQMFREAHIPFGFSTMVTHQNLGQVTSRSWLDTMWKRGSRFSFMIDHIPFGQNLNPDYVLTSEDRRQKEEALQQRNREARPLIFNLPADEYKGGSCLSAGRGFVHINANGYVEPCPFTHYAVDNVLDKPYLDILKSDYFSQIREQFTDTDNPTGECLLFKNIEKVQEIAKQTGAFSTENADG